LKTTINYNMMELSKN